MKFALTFPNASAHTKVMCFGLWTMAFLGLGGLSACGGSVSANAKANTSEGAQADANFDVEGGAEGDSAGAWDMTDDSQSEAQTAQATPAGQSGTAGGGERALLGARHDLLLAEGSRENCKCLAAVLGPANAPAFVWTGRRPVVDPNGQLVVALASEGISCKEAKSGASYQGYELVGGDVVVRVEPAVAGRPVTHGAIIPRPDAAHQVYIEPAAGGVHGKSLSGEDRCALGNGG